MDDRVNLTATYQPAKLISDSEATWADVIVVGGGGAGLAAAIEAATLGRSVILLEKNPHVGGSTILSIGSFSASGTPHQVRAGIKDNPDDHFEDIGKFNALVRNAWPGFENEDNLVLRRMLVDNAGDTFNWLLSLGVRFFGPTLEYPHRRPRMHNVLPNSRAYGYWLEKRARKIGVDLRTSRRVTRLLTRGERVAGVECERADGTLERYASRGGMVLACGDFSAGAEMKRHYARPELVDMRTACNPANVGDGHFMLMAMGGRMVNAHMSVARIRFVKPQRRRFVTMLPPWHFLTAFMEWSLDNMPAWLLRPFILSFLVTVLEAQNSLFRNGAILVNKRGERFTDETKQAVYALASQPDQSAFIVFDDALAKKYSAFPNFVSTAPGVAYAYVPDYARSRKDIFFKANTLADLARKAGLDPAALERTVGARNAEIAKQSGGAAPILKAPFYALGPAQCMVKGTDAGLAVNARLQLLGPDDKPIDEALFGAGLLGQGGIMLEGHGHHLAWAFVSGRIAGRSAANLVTTPAVEKKETGGH